MADVVMPRLSDSMEEGTVLRWLKSPGDDVRRGEELVEIETDKATMTYESDQDGVLEIVAAEGDTLPIGAVIARIGGATTAGSSGNGATATPAADQEEIAAGAPAPIPAPTVPTAATSPPSVSPATRADAAPTPGARLKASPIARRIARQLGVDLAALAGSGPGGRILRADVEAAAGGAAPATPPVAPAPGAPAASPSAPLPPPAGTPSPVAAPSEVGTAKGEVSQQELSRTQQVVARRMAESRATIPDFTLQVEVDMGAAVQMRAALKALGPEVLPTYNDMIVKACAIALREFPRANASYRDGRFELHSRVNVGIAVATADSLVVPTVFDADAKSLLAIARDARALAERVRAATITPPELSGGTFTVSNLGMFGVRSFTAVINPPQAAILSVGSVEQRPVVRDGRLVAGHTMSVTLACDHRILYGADAARFLARVRALLEQPLALTL